MPDLKDWIGRSESAGDLIAPTPCAAMSATLDREGLRPPPGTPLPPLWHWLYFLPLARESEIGADGHPERGGFLPPVALPRRMWAGGRLRFGAPLKVGDDARRVSTIESIEEKSGRSGSLVFVTVRHEIGVPGKAPAIVELQDIVYRDEAKPGAAPEKKAAPAKSAWEKRWIADEVFLFRYSALIFNGHRIHYDRRYVTEVERYPGLIVHGPLIATLLVDLLREKMPGARLASFEFRAVHPLFDGRPFFTCGEPQGKSIQLWARNHEDALCMEAKATLD